MTRGKILGTGTLALSILAFICTSRHLPVTHTALAAPSFSASLENNQLTLSGSVGSDAHRSAVITRAQELLKGTRVKIADHLATGGDVATAGWEPALPALLSILTALNTKGSIEIHDQVITVSGMVANGEQKAKVMHELTAVTGSAYRLEDRLTVLPSVDTSGRDVPARPSRASIQSSLNEILRRETIAFESKSAAMSPRGRAVVDKLIPILRRAPDLSVEVGGHTDTFGDREYNLQLSQRRAESVRQYLLKHEVPNRVSAVGYGASRPLSNARTRVAQQKNRRIELHVKEER
ncbi:MAG: OmpA family protein [Nitrospiraceae bacterium]